MNSFSLTYRLYWFIYKILLYIYLYIRYKTRVKHILQKVKKMQCFSIYADVFASVFCLVAIKQHSTVTVTEWIHSIQHTIRQYCLGDLSVERWHHIRSDCHLSCTTGNSDMVMSRTKEPVMYLNVCHWVFYKLWVGLSFQPDWPRQIILKGNIVNCCFQQINKNISISQTVVLYNCLVLPISQPMWGHCAAINYQWSTKYVAITPQQTALQL